jgi:hypothetical protein
MNKYSILIGVMINMKKWYENITFKQTKNDYNYLVETYGEPCDFCGTLCNNELFQSLLDGEISRKECYIQMIEYIFTNGIETKYSKCSSDLKPNEDDIRVQKIKERYFIE